MADAIASPAAPMPPDDTLNGLAEFVTLGFTMVLYYLNRGRKAQFLVGMWLYRLKQKMGHGAFTEELERFADLWKVSVETLRRRMKFYRDVRAKLEKLYYGDLSLAAIKEKLAELEAAADPAAIADEKSAQIEETIKATARESIERHKAHTRTPTATVRVDGLTSEQHGFLLKIIKQLKAALSAENFNDRLLEFFSTWASELPPEEKKRKQIKKHINKPIGRNSHVAFPMPKLTTRKPLIFASDEDVL